jgi:arginine-tRNA-protein transferase
LEDGYDTNLSHGGTYHQQYRLCNSRDSFDGPLIAVGVVGEVQFAKFYSAVYVAISSQSFSYNLGSDILPSCLSSVYAFYDPCLSAKLELGKYTALREIEWVRRAKWIQDRNYYLGYYINSCQKMFYKAEYKPSSLLCPVHYKWVDFEVAKNRLESKSPVRHCCALYEDEKSDDIAEQSPRLSIEKIVLDIGEGGLLTVSMLSREGRRLIDSVVSEFADEVGPEIARKLIVKLS